MRRAMAMAAMLLLALPVAHAQPAPRVGDSYEITRISDSSWEINDGSVGSTHDQDALIERVIAVRETGLELEYDVPGSQDRASNWQFPVRIFKPFHGPMQLLNRAELEARVDPWLKAGELTRAACGRWIFTWNAFRIECDPQSAIRTLEMFALDPEDLREGAIYKDPKARGSAPLRRRPTGANGYIVELAVDPEAVRRDRAESDIVVAEVSGKTLTLDAARRARSAEDISGTIRIRFDTDSAGNARRRTRVTKLEIRTPDGRSEKRTVTETVERRPIDSRRNSSVI